MVTYYFKKHLDIKKYENSAGLRYQAFLKTFISLLPNTDSVHLNPALFQILSETVYVMHTVYKQSTGKAR